MKIKYNIWKKKKKPNKYIGTDNAADISGVPIPQISADISVHWYIGRPLLLTKNFIQLILTQLYFYDTVRSISRF